MGAKGGLRGRLVSGDTCIGEVCARGMPGRSTAMAHPRDSPCDSRGCCGVLGRAEDGKRLADMPVLALDLLDASPLRLLLVDCVHVLF